MTWEVREADCVEAMAEMDEASVDAVVCDPPYHLTFMGREWDHASTPAESQAQHYRWATEALRVLKPGGHLLAFGGTRTSHRLACAIEDAGFEIRDSVVWMYASGFPKSLSVSKAIDKAAGVERQVVETIPDRWAGKGDVLQRATQDEREEAQITADATPEAEAWSGWGTALKPAHEPIVVARRPLEGTVAANVLEHGTGALNIDATRVQMSDEDAEVIRSMGGYGEAGYERTPGEALNLNKTPMPTQDTEPHARGRWPANVALSHHPDCRQTGTRKVKGGTAVNRHHAEGEKRGYDASSYAIPSVGGADHGYTDGDGNEEVPAYECVEGCPVAALDEQSGEIEGQVGMSKTRGGHRFITGDTDTVQEFERGTSDSGGASRFFFVAKASRAERNAGLDSFPEQPGPSEDYGTKAQHPLMEEGRENKVLATKNPHPTVKPIELMRWLIRLVTPPGAVVLDPFAGSGTTGIAAALEGCDFVGIEREAEYVEIARARIKAWASFDPGTDTAAALKSKGREQEQADRGQMRLMD